ncbi:MAG: hypothetical protein K8F91_03970 [Candidatus Obscuribacterales bacterium]|nr:hypothetical protein [Candidatus Obscuribacterales bacterium]
MTFRTLYGQVLDYKGENLAEDILFPSIPRLKNFLSSAKRLGSFGDNGQLNSPQEEELMDLYEVNRLNDLLLLSFQKDGPGVNPWDQSVASVSREEYQEFFEELGFCVSIIDIFSP